MKHLYEMLCGFEAWSLTLSDEAKFRVFENRIFRKIYRLIHDSESDKWRIQHNFNIHEGYNRSNETLKSRRLSWAGHLDRMGEDRTEFRPQRVDLGSKLCNKETSGDTKA